MRSTSYLGDVQCETLVSANDDRLWLSLEHGRQVTSTQAVGFFRKLFRWLWRVSLYTIVPRTELFDTVIV
jgi:hypothetical protein